MTRVELESTLIFFDSLGINADSVSQPSDIFLIIKTIILTHNLKERHKLISSPYENLVADYCCRSIIEALKSDLCVADP